MRYSCLFAAVSGAVPPPIPLVCCLLCCARTRKQAHNAATKALAQAHYGTMPESPYILPSSGRSATCHPPVSPKHNNTGGEGGDREIKVISEVHHLREAHGKVLEGACPSKSLARGQTSRVLLQHSLPSPAAPRLALPVSTCVR